MSLMVDPRFVCFFAEKTNDCSNDRLYFRGNNRLSPLSPSKVYLELVGLPAAGGRQRLPDREQTVLLQELRDARGVLGLRDLPRLDTLHRVRLPLVAAVRQRHVLHRVQLGVIAGRHGRVLAEETRDRRVRLGDKHDALVVAATRAAGRVVGMCAVCWVGLGR